MVKYFIFEHVVYPSLNVAALYVHNSHTVFLSGPVYTGISLQVSLFTRYWGVKLLNRLKSMNARTTTSKETEGSKKKNAALKRFKNFLIWEAIAASIWIMEQGASVALKYSYLVSLSKSPMIIFAMKVTQRGTEFVMMTLLAYLVCLKTASINFTKVSLGITELQRNYVLFSHLFPSFIFALRTSVCQP